MVSSAELLTLKNASSTMDIIASFASDVKVVFPTTQAQVSR